MIGRAVAPTQYGITHFHSAPAVPAGTRVYAVGDVHGRSDLLARLHLRIQADARADPASRQVVVHLGDYIDRGPDSRGVLDLVARGFPGSFEMVNLKGNHEDMLLRFLDGRDPSPEPWLWNGGEAFLASYGLSDVGWTAEALRRALSERIAPSHLALLRRLRMVHREGGYIFVHAGVRPGVALDAQRDEDLMWIRRDFLTHCGSLDAMVVHGHSIDIEPQVMRNRIGIDTGAYRTGRLTCLVLEGADRRFIFA